MEKTRLESIAVMEKNLRSTNVPQQLAEPFVEMVRSLSADKDFTIPNHTCPMVAAAIEDQQQIGKNLSLGIFWVASGVKPLNITQMCEQAVRVHNSYQACGRRSSFQYGTNEILLYIKKAALQYNANMKHWMKHSGRSKRTTGVSYTTHNSIW